MNNIYGDYSNNLYYRDCQIVYMREILCLPYKEIAEYVDLAINTIKTYYFKRRKELLEIAKNFFDKMINTFKIKKYEPKKNTNIIYECDITNTPCAYILEMYDTNDYFIYLKVGKTIRIEDRMQEILKEYKKYSVDKIIVKKVYDVSDEDDAYIMESTLRKFYKQKKDCGYIRNDRFENVYFNNEELEQNDKIQTQYNLLKNN